MPLIENPHQALLKEAGWHSRGYLPHFDGRAIPQFITLRLYDSMPDDVLKTWMHELNVLNSTTDQILLQKRIEKYLDHGYGNAFMKDPCVAEMVQKDLLHYDGKSYRLSSWVVMPNHIHFLITRFEAIELADIMQSLKSLTSHKANRILMRSCHFWMEDYFDRYIRNPEHFARTVQYIENNPVKAQLCKKPEDWPFSSARFRERREREHPSLPCNSNALLVTGSAGALARTERAGRKFVGELWVSWSVRSAGGRGRPRSQY